VIVVEISLERGGIDDDNDHDDEEDGEKRKNLIF
jgi:hypothetical protein